MKKLFYLLLLILSILIVSLSSNHSGIGLTPDSAEYLSGAENILQRGKYYSSVSNWDCKSDITPIIAFPPGYSLFLTLTKLIQNDQSFLIFINICLLFATFVLLYLVLKKLKIYKFLSFSLLITSIGFYYCFLFVWSETLFLPLFLIFILYLINYYENPSLSDYYLISTILSVLLIVRYIGVFWFFSFQFLLLINENSRKLLRENIYKYMFGLLITLIPLLIYLVRNYYAAGIIFGRNSLGQNFIEKTKEALVTIGNLFVPHKNMEIVAIIITILFLIILSLIKKQNQVKILFGLALGYTVFLIVVGTLTDIGKIDYRLISPSLFLFMIVFVSLNLFEKKKPTYILFLILTFNLVRLNLFVYRNFNSGISDFNRELINKSNQKFSEQLNDLSLKIYSNRPDLLFLMYNRSTKFLPIQKSDVNSFVASLQKEKWVIIYFKNIQYNEIITYHNWRKTLSNFICNEDDRIFQVLSNKPPLQTKKTNIQ